MSAKMIKDGNEYPIGVLPNNYPASNIGYSNTASGLSATKVQGVIDELATDVDNLKKYQYTRKAKISFTTTDPIDFTAPTDGYLCVFSANPNTEVLVRFNGADGNNIIVKNGIIATSSSNWKFDTLYMRKNMIVTIIPSGGTNGGYQFFGF